MTVTVGQIAIIVLIALCVGILIGMPLGAWADAWDERHRGTRDR